MKVEIIQKDISYSFEVEGNDLTIEINGSSTESQLQVWRNIQSDFELQLKEIVKDHEIKRVHFVGDKFGEGIFFLCRYELRGILNKICAKEYRIIERNTMKLYYIEDNIFCGKRCSEECTDGLTIEVEAPLDTIFHFNREDGAEYESKLKNGVAEVPSEFLIPGHMRVYAVKPHGIPTNALSFNIECTKNGRKIIGCNQELSDLIDAVYKLSKAYYKTEKRVSDHIDGYEVI